MKRKLRASGDRVTLIALALSALLSLPAAVQASGGSTNDPKAAQYSEWVQEMKENPRGPFERIRWFCKDGTLQPPKAYACKDHGGGIQHGEWNQRTKTMRENGYLVANVLADVDPADYSGGDARRGDLAQILLERFLMGMDDGWIMRGALTYRGALQAEDEEAGALALVLAMLDDPAWLEPSRYALLRETVRLLPIQTDAVSASTVRQLALEIDAEDSGFRDLRIKIHGAPDAEDASRVRDYAKRNAKPAVAAEYEKLASAIDELYAAQGAVETLTTLAAQAEGEGLRQFLTEGASDLGQAASDAQRLQESSILSAKLRDRLADEASAADRLVNLLASLALERDVYSAGNNLTASLDRATRRKRLEYLWDVSTGLYGSGAISKRQLLSAHESLDRLLRKRSITLDQYREEIRYLARLPEWSVRTYNFHFADAMARFSQIEPLTHLYTQDRVRGGPALFAGAITDSLGKDANQIAGVEHELFGARVGGGLRALNPGLARGRLYAPKPEEVDADLDPEGIYLLPETISDLPRVGGILTQGEGSSLSHVQLLARNLGIPNVVVGTEVLPQVMAHLGQEVVLAVSPGGVVQLTNDGPRWAGVFGDESQSTGDVVIRPDLDKLDLTVTSFAPLTSLRATDSGALSGPKGANLGELKHYFSDAVPGGFVIPFGTFRKLLDQPIEAGGPSVYDWMKQNYAEIEELEGQPKKQKAHVRKFLARLREWIENSDPGPDFREQLNTMLAENFGPDGSFGAFVRSDTNVEDLPGFTGAGLNLTIANVVGYENIFEAIRLVWASPFTERAYGWRQAHMEDPEYVFPAVVVQYSLPAEKSGVMVTTDLEDGQPGWISVAVSEGVGGAVDGQATESLRIRQSDGEVRFLAQASAPFKRDLSEKGGIELAPASGSDAVLTPNEIAQLIAVSKDAPARFPDLQTESGETMAADIEFAFVDGRLYLLQLRPLVESKSANRNQYLSSLDGGSKQRGGTAVPLDALPQAAAR